MEQHSYAFEPEKPLIKNIATYKFVSLDEEWVRSMRCVIRAHCRAYDVWGTILLSTEGINIFVAGTVDSIEQIWSYITSFPMFSDMVYKESYTEIIPFDYLHVKIKKEIIPMGHNIRPEEFTAPRVYATELKQWLDEGRDVVLLDTRNTYEIEHGTFENAMIMPIGEFRTFPTFVEKLDESLKDKTIVTFCTGGIRCEKAGAYMIEQGFNNVFQLEGGILKYFEEVGRDHYNGNCFVFDGRVAVDPALHAVFDNGSSDSSD